MVEAFDYMLIVNAGSFMGRFVLCWEVYMTVTINDLFVHAITLVCLKLFHDLKIVLGIIYYRDFVGIKQIK